LKFIALVEQGFTVNEATEAVGRTPGWYQSARANHPAFAQAVTAARLHRNDTSLEGIDFVTFRNTYFGNYTAPHHYRMVEAFQSAEPGSMTVVLAFPGAGKSTTLVDKYCHLLAEDPDQRICVISEGQQLSRNLIGQVSDRMSDAERFKAYHLRYGPFRADPYDDSDRAGRSARRPWTADYFTILDSKADQKDPSLASFGATSRIYGSRFDWMIFDDIQSNETLANTDKYLQSMRTSWGSRTNLGDGERGKMIMVGSRVGPGDIYERMADLQMLDRLVTIPALTHPLTAEEHFVRSSKGTVIANPDPPHGAQPTWSAMTMQQLAEMRAFAGEEVWARTYMQDLQVEVSQVFTEEMLTQAKDPHRTIGPAAVGTDVWASVDPALDSGVCAFLAAAVSPDRLTVLDSIGRTDVATYQTIYEQVAHWGARYRPSTWIVEENNFQKGLQQDDRMLTAASRHGAEVTSHRTGRNKNDPVMGIRMMANAFHDGQIRIPWGDERTRQLMEPLVQELRTWRPNVRGSKLKMDRVMTLWFLWTRWQIERDAMNTVIPLFDRPSWVRSA
jgi:hypothetical protein